MSLKLKDILKEIMREMSVTGTGASVTPGEGEGVSIKYAWVGGSKIKKKKQK